jgi:tetratricopeptide (TPR) repeat protein
MKHFTAARMPAWAGIQAKGESAPLTRPLGLRLCMGLAILVILVASTDLPRAAGRPSQAVVEAVRQAQAAYEEGRFDAALALYRGVLASGWRSTALYYNLGCASYKQGQIGWAVAYLEEARRLSPRDPNVLHNLRILAARSGDRVPQAEPSRLLGLLSAILDSYAPRDVVRLFTYLLWVAAAALAVHWTAGRALRRWSRRGLFLTGLLLFLGVAGLFLKAYQVASAPTGVVVAEEAQVLSGPRAGETVQFILHGGTLLHLGREAGDWREIWLSDQMRGWVKGERVTGLSKPQWFR